MRGFKVFFINLIGHKGILHPRRIQQPCCICFLHIHTANLRKKQYLSKF